VTKRLSYLLLAAGLIAGVVLRVIWLGEVPPGLHPDEACNGYDAYSILLTGRDHHGNFLPIAFQGFGDYRMPLFNYSLAPLIAIFGLNPVTVRLGAALWGCLDLVAITALAGVTLGVPAAAVAALLGALSPWHLPFSRYGIEATTASATVSLAMLCFFLWVAWRRDRWLLLGALFFGLSLYSYAVTRAFTPLIIGLLAALYWRELKQARFKALGAIVILVLLAAPQAVLLLTHFSEVQQRFNQLSIFHYMSSCEGCNSRQRAVGYSLVSRIDNFGANWISGFTPSFLFINGDRGDHWTMLHPPGFGELLPEQAPLVLLALIPLFSARRRKLAIALIGWVVLAALPAALIMPLGAWNPETSAMPTPHVLFHYTREQLIPLTPGLLLSHPDSRHDVLAFAPWLLISALGFTVLLELTSKMVTLSRIVVGLLLAGVMFNGAAFVRSYFRDYPKLAAPYFQYGIAESLQAVDTLGHGHSMQVVITPRISEPYIYVLFFEHYPPARFQRQQGLQMPGPLGQVVLFDRYLFVTPDWLYKRFPHGIFVFRGVDPTPKQPAVVIRYPDGTSAYKVVVNE